MRKLLVGIFIAVVIGSTPALAAEKPTFPPGRYVPMTCPKDKKEEGPAICILDTSYGILYFLNTDAKWKRFDAGFTS